MTNRRQKPSQTLVIAQNPFSNLKVGRKQEVEGCIRRPADPRIILIAKYGGQSFTSADLLMLDRIGLGVKPSERAYSFANRNVRRP